MIEMSVWSFTILVTFGVVAIILSIAILLYEIINKIIHRRNKL